MSGAGPLYSTVARRRNSSENAASSIGAARGERVGGLHVRLLLQGVGRPRGRLRQLRLHLQPDRRVVGHRTAGTQLQPRGARHRRHRDSRHQACMQHMVAVAHAPRPFRNPRPGANPETSPHRHFLESLPANPCPAPKMRQTARKRSGPRTRPGPCLPQAPCRHGAPPAGARHGTVRRPVQTAPGHLQTAIHEALRAIPDSPRAIPFPTGPIHAVHGTASVLAPMRAPRLPSACPARPLKPGRNGPLQCAIRRRREP